MLTKILIFKNPSNKAFTAVYVTDNGTFQFGPFDTDMQVVAQTLAKQLNKKGWHITEDCQIVFPTETTIHRLAGPGKPVLTLLEPLRDILTERKFFDALKKETEILSK